MSATTSRPTRRPAAGAGVVRRWLAASLLLGLAVVLLVLVAGGGAPGRVPEGLPDPGPITGWGLPAARLLADLAGVAALGMMLGAALLVPSPAERLAPLAARATVRAARASVVWAGAVCVQAVLTLSDLLAISPGQALAPSVMRSFLTQTPQGRALLVQLLLVLLLAAVARAVLTTRGATLGTVLALVALVPPLLTGHSAGSGNHELAVASLLVHVLAAALWVGGLAALTWTGFAADALERESGLRHALPRFSVLALVCLVAVLVSGVLNAAVRLGSFGAWVGSAYGWLVTVKVLLLLVLGGFGWWHRQRTVAQVGADRRDARRLFVRVAAVELLVMVATVGVAVGLSRTPTPVPEELDRGAAYDLLGFDLPPAPTLGRLVLGWNWDGFAIAALLGLALLYAAGLRTLRRRGDSWPVGRTLAWYAGVAVAAWATVGGLGLYSHVMFSAHMGAHMLLGMVAPIGLVLGAPVTLALRTLPGPRVRGETGMRQLLMAFLHSGPMRVVAHPVVAAVLFTASLYAIYFSPLFPALMSSHLGHAAMEAHFLLVGCLFFWVLVGVDPSPRQLPAPARAALLLLVMPFHAFFAVELMSYSTVLAGDYYRALARPYATDLLADQHLGGGLSWAMGEIPIVLVMAAIFVQWFRSDAREAARADRSHSAGRSGRARPAPRRTPVDEGEEAPVRRATDHDSYNAWLAQLGQEAAAAEERDQTRRRNG